MKNRIKVVIDTNIFIQGWFSNNVYCEQILQLIDDRKLQLLFAQDTIGELVYITKNFARHNFKKIEDRIIALQTIMILFYYGTSVNTVDVDCEKSNDKYDDMFLKCAIKGEADYLITDDFKHGMHDKELIIKVVGSEEFINTYNN